MDSVVKKLKNASSKTLIQAMAKWKESMRQLQPLLRNGWRLILNTFHPTQRTEENCKVPVQLCRLQLLFQLRDKLFHLRLLLNISRFIFETRDITPTLILTMELLIPSKQKLLAQGYHCLPLRLLLRLQEFIYSVTIQTQSVLKLL
jgi:hypothetical protein